jgi:LuxR family maltose regulon positive regulatory protein
MLAGINALHGDMPEARHYVELIRAGEWPENQLDGYQGTYYRVAEALLALEESDVERARQQVAFFDAHRATSEHWVTITTVEALVELRSGRPPAALTRLESAAEVRGREAHAAGPRRELSRIRALANLAAGNTREAKTILHKDAGEDRFETIVERARIALIENRSADVLRILGQEQVRPATARLRAAASSLRTAALLRTVGPADSVREAQSLGSLLCDRQLRMPLAFLPPADLEGVLALLAESAPCEIGPVRSALPDARAVPALTERERVVLRSLMSTSSLSAVAKELGVSPNTVKTQLRSVYRKLDVTGREEAVAIAISRNLLSDDA